MPTTTGIFTETSAAAIAANDRDTFKSYFSTNRKDVGFFGSRHWWKKGALRRGIARFVRQKFQPGDDTPPSDRTCHYFTEKGEAFLDRTQSILDRARAMLTRGEVAESSVGLDSNPYRYPWATTQPPPDAQTRIWRATVDDFATGEGLTIYYGARRARDEDEFRREIARAFGYPLADAAKLGVGLDSHVQFEGMFLSPNLRARLARFDRGEDPPVAISFFARYNTNYS